MAEIKKDRQQTLKHGVHGLPLKFHFLSIQPRIPLNPWHFHVNNLFMYIVKGTLLDCFTLKSNESHNEPNISSSNKASVVHISVHIDMKCYIHLW